MQRLSPSTGITALAPVRRVAGALGGGREVGEWTLALDDGTTATILELGACLATLRVPDVHGAFADVVLGFDVFQDWVDKNDSYFGVVPGRVAGRVPGGLLRFEGEEYVLPCNEGENHLHGGAEGISREVWRGEALEAAEEASGVRLTLHSPDGAGGYPGAIEITVCYRLTSDRALIFETEVTSDRMTPVSLPQHGYFNLGGHDSGSALGHEVRILSSEVMTTDEKMTPLGKAQEVAGTAADLREGRVLGEVIEGLWQHHGDLYRLGAEGDLKEAAVVRDPVTGRTMTVETTHGFLQFYASAHLDGSVRGKGGASYPQHAALCFECQGYPDPGAGFGDILVRPGRPQRHRTVYSFSAGAGEEQNP